MTRLNIPLFVALAVSILATVPANAGGDTLPHQRMIRKRGPAIIERIQAYDHGLHIRQADPTRSAASSPGTSAAASATSAPASATRSSASSVPPTTSAAATSSATSETTSVASSTSSGGLLDSLTSSLLASTSSVTSTSSIPTTTSTSSVVTTSSSSSSIAPQTTEAATTNNVQPTLNLATAAPTSASAGTITVNVVTSTAAAAEASKSAHEAKVQKITRNTIITLVVIASCIGGAIAIWTVIRKWKLSPSEKFDDRMNPIDWAPPAAAGAHEETMEEKRHRRAGSTGSHGSFGTVAPSENGHAKGMYNDSQQGHGYGLQPQDFPPAHDFTAGTAQPGYGQYYGGQQYAGGAPGYADLQRGPSMSESTYSHGASINRGLSYNRGPAAGYEAQPGAGGVPPLPNPYGGEHGYDDYAHGQQPVQQPPQGQYRGF